MKTIPIHKHTLRKLRAVADLAEVGDTPQGQRPRSATSATSDNFRKLRCFPCLALASAALILVACGKSPSAEPNTTSHATQHENPAGDEAELTTFIEGKGVRMDDSCKKILQLETVEVMPAESTPGVTGRGQVFRLAGEATRSDGAYQSDSAYASAIIPAEQVPVWTSVDSARFQSGQGDFTGRVHRIDRQLEPVTGEVEVIFAIDDPEKKLALGTFLEVRADGAGEADPLQMQIPRSAILRTARGNFAYAENGGHFFRTPIEVEKLEGDQAWISEGLYEGDLVASTSVEHLYLIELQVTNGGKGCAHGH